MESWVESIWVELSWVELGLLESWVEVRLWVWTESDCDSSTGAMHCVQLDRKLSLVQPSWVVLNWIGLCWIGQCANVNVKPSSIESCIWLNWVLYGWIVSSRKVQGWAGPSSKSGSADLWFAIFSIMSWVELERIDVSRVALGWVLIWRKVCGGA